MDSETAGYVAAQLAVVERYAKRWWCSEAAEIPDWLESYYNVGDRHCVQQNTASFHPHDRKHGILEAVEACSHGVTPFENNGSRNERREPTASHVARPASHGSARPCPRQPRSECNCLDMAVIPGHPDRRHNPGKVSHGVDLDAVSAGALGGQYCGSRAWRKKRRVHRLGVRSLRRDDCDLPFNGVSGCAVDDRNDNSVLQNCIASLRARVGANGQCHQ